MSTIYITVAMACVPLAFSLLVWSTSFASLGTRVGLFWAGVAMFVIGLLAWWQAQRIAKREELQTRQERERLNAAIASLNHTTSSLKLAISDMKTVMAEAVSDRRSSDESIELVKAIGDTNKAIAALCDEIRRERQERGKT